MKKVVEISEIVEKEWWEIKEELEALLKDWDLKYKYIN